MAAHVVPDDPEYLSPRNREAYSYRAAGDTAMWGRTIAAYEVEARAGEEDLTTRRVRLFVDPRTDDVVGLVIERRGLQLLFREETQARIMLRPSAGGDWFPHSAHVETALRVPLRPLQRLRTEITYRHEPDTDLTLR